MMLNQLARGGLVTSFSRCEIAEQLACWDVSRTTRRCDIEFTRFTLHVSRFLTDSLQTKVFDQPDRPARVEVGHVLAPQWHNEIAEPLPIEFDQPAPMLVLLCRHAIEHSSRRGISGAQLGGISGVDLAVLLFGGDRQRQHLLLRQITKAALSGSQR